MKHILFPTAYTKHSNVAYRYAQKLASYFEAGITLVHIYKNPKPIFAEENDFSEIDMPGIEFTSEKQWEEEMAKLKDFAKEMDAKQYAHIPLDFIVTDGNVAEELIDIQQNNNFDLVVMGMRRHNLAERLFGTTTYTLINEANCPMLLIPPDSHFMGMDSIVYGTAFEFGEMKAIDHLLDWSLAFDASLHILHVHSIENLKEAAEKMDLLQNQFKKESELKIIDFQLMEGEIIDAVEKYLKRTSADILAVHRRKKGFWHRIKEGSLTKTLAEEINIPLLVLRS